MEVPAPVRADYQAEAPTEDPIDVLQSKATGEQLTEMTEGHRVPKEAPIKSTVSASKKKGIDSLLIEQAALSQLHHIAAGSVPAVGLVHGDMLDQGLLLIKRISVLPRSIEGMCRWTVAPVPSADVFPDAVGVFILESGLTEFKYNMAALKNRLPAGLEAPVILRIHRFLNSYDQLILQTQCSLYSPNLETRIKSVPCYRQAGFGPVADVQRSQAFLTELSEVSARLEGQLSRTMALRTELLQIEGQEHDRANFHLLKLNEEAHLDRVLLELRCNINKRIIELERVWSSKKAKLDPEEASTTPKDQICKFRGHVVQLALKEFTGANASLAQKPPPLNGPDYLPSILIKSTAGASNPAKSGGAGAKRKANPAPKTKPSDPVPPPTN